MRERRRGLVSKPFYHHSCKPAPLAGSLMAWPVGDQLRCPPAARHHLGVESGHDARPVLNWTRASNPRRDSDLVVADIEPLFPLGSLAWRLEER